MARPNYVNVYVPPDGHREKWLQAVCDRLGLDHEHRDYLVAIDAALAAMVAALTERKGEDRMEITVEFSEAALFGTVDPEEEGIDAAASVANFADALINHLYDAYPDAETEVTTSINDRVMVDGMEDHEEMPWIEDIIDKVFQGDDWITA